MVKEDTSKASVPSETLNPAAWSLGSRSTVCASTSLMRRGRSRTVLLFGSDPARLLVAIWGRASDQYLVSQSPLVSRLLRRLTGRSQERASSLPRQ